MNYIMDNLDMIDFEIFWYNNATVIKTGAVRWPTN